MQQITDSPHFTTTLRGILVHYELYNPAHKDNGPVYVLIHGFLSSTFSFRHLIPLLSEENTVLAVDLPPFGRSGKVKSFVYSYANLADVVISLVEQLHLSTIVLIGHSMGGQIALYVEKKRPDLIHKKILLCSSSYLPRSKFPLLHFSYLPFFSFFLKRTLHKQGVLTNLKRVVYNQKIIDDEMMDGYIQPFYDNNIFIALTRMVRDREGDLTKEQLRQITRPTLLIWGEEDRVVPLTVGKKLHNDLKDSVFITYKNVGHLIPEEIPEDIFKNIKQFV